MKESQSGADSTNIALTDGLLDFSDFLAGIAPRLTSSHRNARMRSLNASRMRDDENNGNDNLSEGNHEEANDSWATSDDADAETDAGTKSNQDDDLDENDQDESYVPPSRVPPVQDFSPAPCGPLVAVDAGLIRLAEVAGGLIIAIRAAIVVENPTALEGKSQVYLLRSGPLYLPWASQLQVLHAVGKAMGEPSLFVTLDKTDPANPMPAELKRGSDRPDLYSHRIMVLWERLAQQMAVEIAPKGGILLLDGALTLRSRDTPPRFLKNMVKKASDKNVSVVALSKQSGLLVGPDAQSVKAIRFWLDDAPYKVAYRLLSPLLDAAPTHFSENGKPAISRRADRILGRCYAARLSPLGETYRLDVKAASGISDAEVMDQLLASSMIVSGYLSLLAQAHAHGYFGTTDVLALQVQATGMYGLHPQTGLSATGAFAPYQGTYK